MDCPARANICAFSTIYEFYLYILIYRDITRSITVHISRALRYIYSACIQETIEQFHFVRSRAMSDSDSDAPAANACRLRSYVRASQSLGCNLVRQVQKATSCRSHALVHAHHLLQCGAQLVEVGLDLWKEQSTSCSRACHANDFSDWASWISPEWRERCCGSFLIVWCLCACRNCNTCLQPYENITSLAHLVPKCPQAMRTWLFWAYCTCLCLFVDAWAHQPANVVSERTISWRPI